MSKSSSGECLWLSPPQIAKQLGICVPTVHGWIRSGQLRAVNVAQTVTSRPRWRVSAESFAEFLKCRESPSPVTQQTIGVGSHRRRISVCARAPGEKDGRLAQNIPHEVRVKRMAVLMANRQSGWGAEWRPFVKKAAERYVEKMGVKVDEDAVSALKAWWEE